MNARDHVSDADVLTAVRDSLSGMPLASPPDVETIMARGRRTRRHRRLIPGVSGTLAVAAGAALAVVLAEASRPLTSAQNKVTCAWPFEKVDAATEAPSRRSSAARAEPEDGGRKGRTRWASGKPEESPQGKPEDVR